MTTTPTVGRVTSRWGPRDTGIPGASTYHRGVDIAAPAGTPVVAPEAGTITASTYHPVSGHYVIVDHGRFRTKHQHLLSRSVDVGQWVGEGQDIGEVGSTGLSKGAHLHTEVHDGTTPIDPEPWYRARGVTLGVRTAVAGVTITAPQEDQMQYIFDEARGYGAAVYPSGEWALIPDGGDINKLAAGAHTTVVPITHDSFVALTPPARRNDLDPTPAPVSVDVDALVAALAGPLAAALRAAGVTPA